MPKLRHGERCPIHRSVTCCGRTFLPRQRGASKWEKVSPGIRRIADPHSDFGDGYRYKYSPAVTRRVLLKRVEIQAGNCEICGKPFTDITDVVPDHKLPRGLAGARRDDRFIVAAHSACNLRKGSKRS